MTDLHLVSRLAAVLTAAVLMLPPDATAQQASTRPDSLRNGDHIAAVIDQELVTAGEVQQRIARERAQAQRAGAKAPDEDALRRQVLDALIDERVIISHARNSGVRIDEPEIERAVTSVAAQNQVTVVQLRERLRQDGIDFRVFRNSLRDQMLVERVRERDVQPRIRVTDAEIEAYLDERRKASAAAAELDIAQILVTVAEGAADVVVAQRRARAEQALARVKAGEDFAKVAREMSEDPNRERGGAIGLRSADRLPDLFVEAVRGLAPGQVAPELLRSGAGFHVLGLQERKQASLLNVVQTRARHILLRPSEQLTAQAAAARLAGFKRQIETGARGFEALARENSEDGSAAAGGDLGWVSPGAFVPEFEQAMNALAPGGVSEPVTSRFGLHLIQVVERRNVTIEAKQLREQARNVLRERKFEPAYNEWIRELRSRAYIEMREPPQ